MTTLQAPPADPTLAAARDALMRRCNEIVGLVTRRDDVLLDLVWDQPSGSPPAWFTPGTAWITLDGDIATGGSHPDAVDPTNPNGRLAHPVLVGMMGHEGAHADHSLWLTPEAVPADTPAAVLAAGELLEEARIEAAHLTLRPSDQVYLRAAMTQIVLRPAGHTTTAIAGRWAAARAAALILARADAGVLSPAAVRPLRTAILQVLTRDDLAALRTIWRSALRTADTDTDTMLALARRWCDVVGLDPDNTDEAEQTTLPGAGCARRNSPTPSANPGEPPHSSDTESAEPDQISEALTRVAVNIAADAAEEAATDLSADQSPAPDSDAEQARREEHRDRTEASAAARQTFGSGATDRTARTARPAVTGHRPATAAEKAAANRLALVLQRAHYRARTRITQPSDVPPGRLVGREAMLGLAQRTLGHPQTARPFRQTRTMRAPEPPLTVGIVDDVSGSMGAVVGPMTSAGWTIARAAHRIDGQVAAVAFGDDAAPILRPGYPPADVPLLSATQATRAFVAAIQAIDGILNLATSPGARLLFIASDGDLPGPRQRPDGQRLVTRLAHCGVLIFWLDFNGRTRTMSDTIRIRVDASDEKAVEAIATTVADSLTHA